MPPPTVASPLDRAATQRLGREIAEQQPDMRHRMIREPLRTSSVDIQDLRVVGMDAGPVPAFDVVLADGDRLTSDEWVGKTPFVIAFFASWCQICEQKIPMVRTAVAHVPEVRVLLVSADEPDTWHHVPGFLREQRMLDVPVVSAIENPHFSMAYNPMAAVPLVAVVGRNGGLVDYQIGLTEYDGPRLEAALRRAAGIIGDEPNQPGAPIFEASSDGGTGGGAAPSAAGGLLDPTNILLE